MSIRRRVLSCFKELHKTRKTVFANDGYALNAARLRINEEFNKNRDVEDEIQIEQLIRDGYDAAEYLRKFVVQAPYNPETDAFEMKLTKEHHLEDNFPYLGESNTKEERKNK
ncbi:hypothetical protein LSH36_1051g00042 [Paralvinella palmiformis]|uniref:Complex III assembly factor LYRM7 n=1 Tax=Paralvinella palmiformis TaxID=53620 RepID=A0AAD9MQI4_9ANNE|nr:hypothetical protein LSH36_1051g00042 [Paralvinella palmiformis]